MAFTEYTLPVSRHDYFTFFVTGGGAGTSLSEAFSPGKPVEIEKIRLRLSTAHVSVVDFMVTLSHHLGSYYDQNLLSQAMLGVQDVMYQVDPTIKLHYTDTIRFSCIMSAANLWGLEISGWSITG